MIHSDDTRELADGFQAIMKDPNARKWLMHLVFDVCHVDQRSHVPGDPDSTAYNDAVRMVGQQILQDILLYAPKRLGAFIQEAMERD